VSLRVVTPALFALGVGLMVPFESPVTLALGVLAMLAFVACGVLLVAGPGADLLAAGEEPED
jgi:hypothetical protein